jgi:hypothetical protein
MTNNRIDFISSYCDRWCERCAYTARCSAYACQVAVAMCGNAAEGLELAIGMPHPDTGEKPDPPAAAWLAGFVNAAPTPEEDATFMAAEAARD